MYIHRGLHECGSIDAINNYYCHHRRLVEVELSVFDGYQPEMFAVWE